jgi:hypothetical protein
MIRPAKPNQIGQAQTPGTTGVLAKSHLPNTVGGDVAADLSENAFESRAPFKAVTYVPIRTAL